MSGQFRRSIYFHWIPRLRVYRRPLQIWLCWFGFSLHWLPHIPHERKAGQ